MTKKAEKKRKVRKLAGRKLASREFKRRVHPLPEARTYVTEEHWELW
jgi:hypothetical protein